MQILQGIVVVVVVVAGGGEVEGEGEEEAVGVITASPTPSRPWIPRSPHREGVPREMLGPRWMTLRQRNVANARLVSKAENFSRIFSVSACETRGSRQRVSGVYT
mmetsp:Transcript_2021/g.2797  ORF Transcript_2021/g.2797 Transcript_2021/m.2797 type:complete len:105 (+) Transcript_2021:1001-1315(+)